MPASPLKVKTLPSSGLVLRYPDFEGEDKLMPTYELPLHIRAKNDAAADKKHQDTLDRIRASLSASRAIVERLQQEERASPGDSRQPSTR